MTNRKWLSGLLCVMVLGLGGCHKIKEPGTGVDHVQMHDPNPFVVPAQITPAETIAAAGHGAIFDYQGKPIVLDNERVLSIQQSMVEQLRDSAMPRLKNETRALVQQALELQPKEALSVPDHIVLNAAVIELLQQHADKPLQDKFTWRHHILMKKIRLDYILWRLELDARVHEIIKRFTLDNFFVITAPPETDYVGRCRDHHSVPVPPAWSAAAPGSWRYQGLLDNELILAAADTHLWTWSDPDRRGGCILLPRGGGAAGLICQSATTGHACFWDNIDRKTGMRIPWASQPLNVNNMQDGDVLGENCTGCHRGNNVFLISPDNNTWKKVIQQSQVVANAGANFTTRIENTAVARYIPVSSQQSWTNPSAAQCIGCHERPAVDFSSVPNPMPPTCRTSNTDASNCYR